MAPAFHRGCVSYRFVVKWLNRKIAGARVFISVFGRSGQLEKSLISIFGVVTTIHSHSVVKNDAIGRNRRIFDGNLLNLIGTEIAI